MSGTSRNRLFLVALVMLLVLGCRLGGLRPVRKTPTPTATAASRVLSLSPTVTSTLMPTVTPSPSLTPVPVTPSPAPSPTPPIPDAGALPAHWTELNLAEHDPVSGRAAGVFGVHDLATDASTALLYALGRCAPDSASGLPGVGLCLSVYDPAVDRVLGSTSVVAPSSPREGEEGRLVVAGETLYVHQPWSGVLYALDRQTLGHTAVLTGVYSVAYDRTEQETYIVSGEGLTTLDGRAGPVPVERTYNTAPIEMVACEGSVYVLGDTALYVYNDRLQLTAEVALPGGFLTGLLLDIDHERLYLGGYAGLHVLDTETLRLYEPLAGTPRTTLPNVTAMTLDQEGDRLYVLGRRPYDWYGGYTVLAIDTETWTTDELYSTLSGELRDLALHEDTGRLLLASASDHSLLPISYETLRVAPRLPLGVEIGEVIADQESERLYVSDSAGWVHFFDRHTYDLLDRVYGGRHISLDVERGILYAGDPRVPVVTLLDSQSGQVLSTIGQAGKPRADPAAGRVVILNRRFYTFSADTGQPTGELLPGIGQPAAECPECYYTVGVEVVIDAKRGYTTTLTYTPWPGKPGPSESVDYDPVSGRAYYALRTGGYVHFSSIAAYADLGQLESRGQALRALEGLAGDIRLDASARKLYVARGDSLFVLDSESLNRLGRVRTTGWTPSVAAVDGELGRLYLPRGSKLEIWARTGGAPQAVLPPESMALTNTVTSILPSPKYAEDNTLLATVDGRPARSTDGGETWQRLHGGLPKWGDYRPTVSLAFSPAFAEDRRLFAGVAFGETYGEGVYCSQDAGDTWKMCSDGLLDLRVYRVRPSPAFAQDRTLLAYAHTPRGDALYRSTDEGQSWRLEVRQTEMGRPPLPHLGELVFLPEYEPQIECDYAGVCQRSDDGGRQWQAFDTTGAPLENLVEVRFSPQYELDGTIYFMTSSELFRYQERGQTWSRCQALSQGRQVFGERSYERYLASLAVAASAEGAHHLLVGSMDGEFYRITDGDLVCTALAPEQRPETPQPTPTTCSEVVDPRLEGALSAQEGGPRILDRLGCAAAPAQETGAAMQSFEGGEMLWREDTQEIYVLPDVAKWSVHEDTWTEGQLEPDLESPNGLYAPIRGFGKLWRERLGGSASDLGWATAPESGTVLLIQAFANGLVLQSADGPLWVLHEDGTWKKVVE